MTINGKEWKWEKKRAINSNKDKRSYKKLITCDKNLETMTAAVNTAMNWNVIKENRRVGKRKVKIVTTEKLRNEKKTNRAKKQGE